MAEQSFDLSTLFGTALKAMSEQREDVNTLDGYNGNHGDNMVANLDLIQKALQTKAGREPTEALEHASQQLRQQGRGGTSQYYAQGLRQAAERLQGHKNLEKSDVNTLLETLLGAIPNQGHPTQQENAESVLSQVLGQVTKAPAQDQSSEDEGTDLGDIVEKLLPAGLAFLQARKSGADPMAAAGQALQQAVLGRGSQPAAQRTPRSAAGQIIAKSILKQILN